MQPAPPATPPPPPARRKGLGWRNLLIFLLVIATIFAAGYFPATMRARRSESSLATTQLDLRLANLHRRLGVASHEAQRNNFANAAAAAHEFFQGSRELSSSDAFESQPRTRAALAAYASYEQSVMQQLSTADPQVGERLSGMYLAMDGVLARRQ